MQNSLTETLDTVTGVIQGFLLSPSLMPMRSALMEEGYRFVESELKFWPMQMIW